MSIVFPSSSVLTRISDFLSPPNRPIGPMPRTQQCEKCKPTPIGMRSSAFPLEGEDSKTIASRAADSLPFARRFTLLVFSMRLKFTWSMAGLGALKQDVKAARKDVVAAGDGNWKTVLENLAAKIVLKISKSTPNPIPAVNDGQIYRGF